MKACEYASSRFLGFIFLLLLLPFIVSCGGGGGGGSSIAQLKITFHDNKVDGSSISRIDMTIVETQIIDVNDNKTVISTGPHSFNPS